MKDQQLLKNYYDLLKESGKLRVVQTSQSPDKFQLDKSERPENLDLDKIINNLKTLQKGTEELNKEKNKTTATQKEEKSPEIIEKEIFLNIDADRIESIDDPKNHALYPKIKTLLDLNIPLYLYGPTGSGKSYLVENISKELKQKFIFINSPQDVIELKGFKNIKGDYQGTEYQNIYENGGIYMIDEIDSCPADVLVGLNSDLSGDYGVFPHKIIKKHKDFRLITAGNTTGRGSDFTYTARNRLDASTLNRFLFIDFFYDKELELNLTKNKEPIKALQKIRDSFLKIKSNTVNISTRSLIYFDKLLQSGFPPRSAFNLIFSVDKDNENLNKFYESL